MPAPTARTIYEVPLLFEAFGLGRLAGPRCWAWATADAART